MKRATLQSMSMNLVARRLAILMFALCAVRLPFAAGAQSDADSQSGRKIDMVSFVTWWSHDAVGYHPAIAFHFENISGVDLSGQTIQFQARFTDLHNGYVTVARTVTPPSEFPPNSRRTLVLRGPSSFELPIDQSAWPNIECKVMCRVGDVDDSGTENLMITPLESVVETDEEALDSLSKRFDISPIRQKRLAKHRVDHGDPGTPPPPIPSKPLKATQLSLNSSPPKPTTHMGAHQGLDKFLSQSSIAGLGDNFLQFETTYKQRPTAVDEEFDSNHWTWIRYSRDDPGMFVYDGTKGSSADVLVVRLPADAVQSESQIAQLIKAMAGKFKGQPLEHFKKSVNYRPNNLRVEMSSYDAAGYHAIYISPSTEDNNYSIIISRLPGNPRAVLPEIFRKTQMLKFLTPLLGEPEQE